MTKTTALPHLYKIQITTKRLLLPSLLCMKFIQVLHITCQDLQTHRWQ